MHQVARTFVDCVVVDGTEVSGAVWTDPQAVGDILSQCAGHLPNEEPPTDVQYHGRGHFCSLLLTSIICFYLFLCF